MCQCSAPPLLVYHFFSQIITIFSFPPSSVPSFPSSFPLRTSSSVHLLSHLSSCLPHCIPSSSRPLRGHLLLSFLIVDLSKRTFSAHGLYSACDD